MPQAMLTIELDAVGFLVEPRRAVAAQVHHHVVVEFAVVKK